MGKAVVSTRLGAEGLGYVDGKNILIADEPEKFSGSIVRLLTSPEECWRLGKAGREYVEREYAWPEIGRRMENAYEVALTNKRNRDLG